MRRQFTATYQKRGRWYLGWVEEVPGVNTQGRTLRETRTNLREALRLVLEANREILAREFRSEKPIRESLQLTTSA